MTHYFNVEMYIPPRYMSVSEDIVPQMTVTSYTPFRERIAFTGKEACMLYETLTGKNTEFIRKLYLQDKNLSSEPVETKSEEHSVISNPSHYTEGRKYEPRKVIMDWDLNFYMGNALKYISRAGRKGSAQEDIRKAIQYLEFELERLGEN